MKASAFKTTVSRHTRQCLQHSLQWKQDNRFQLCLSYSCAHRQQHLDCIGDKVEQICHHRSTSRCFRISSQPKQDDLVPGHSLCSDGHQHSGYTGGKQESWTLLEQSILFLHLSGRY